jgi:hypothetical protein
VRERLPSSPMFWNTPTFNNCQPANNQPIKMHFATGLCKLIIQQIKKGCPLQTLNSKP